MATKVVAEFESCWRHFGTVFRFSRVTRTHYMYRTRSSGILSPFLHRTTCKKTSPFFLSSIFSIQSGFPNNYFPRTSLLFNRVFLSTSPFLSSSNQTPLSQRNQATVKYIVAIAIAVVGLSYAAVPLYRVFCQVSGYGGTVALTEAGEKVESMEPIRERELTIKFNADTSASMRWQFKPQQREVRVVPGETALAFYTATNTSDEAITGIATYNVVPFEAGLYFNKIQCFCFEEQRLNPNEQVDMPVFFYIDPEFDEDPAMAKVDTITLSYTFFEAKDGEDLPLPAPS